MSKDIKGVFARLPLSEGQVESVLKSYTGDKESTDICMQKTILDLGTPVTGGKLKTRAWVRFFNYDQTVSFKFSETVGHDPVVLRSDAQAQIAALEAEVVRLREVLSEIAESDDTDNALDPECNKRVARAALKGGAA